MRSLLASLLILGLLPLHAPAADSSPAPSAPHWISLPPSSSGAASRTLTLDRPLQSATLRFAVDHAHATFSMNGQQVLAVAPFCQIQTIDVANHLRRGDNQLNVSLTAPTAPLTPPAFALSLDLRFADGTREELRSDRTWTAPKQDPALLDHGPVDPALWGIARRDLSLSAYENYEQWQQSKTDVSGKYRTKFQVAPGFQVTELRQAAPDEGSWIAMAFDDQGRLTISREDSGFLRLSFHHSRTKGASAPGIAVPNITVQHILAPLLECRGLVYNGQTLYANANNSKGLFSLVITDNGSIRDLTRIRDFPGNVGHGRNDLALQRRPDGGVSLYSIHGDSVDVPYDDVTDLTSPIRESYTLPAKKEGTLIRVDLDPGQPPVTTLLHAGLRNPYGIALDRRGVPFTFDADNEHDMGTPWYRPTRILQLATGGDSGYREVTGQLPPRLHDQPDHAPQLFDIGRSSPTSVMFGDQLKFPPEYRRALYALDWTYGRVLAVHLFPRGQTYRAAGETFFQGRPLNVTDIAAGPDGAMYLITGGRKTQSALYKVTWTGPLAADSDPNLEAGLSDYERSQLSAADRARSTPVASQSADPIARHQSRLEIERSPLDLAAFLPQAAQLPASARFDRLLAFARARKPELVDGFLPAFVTMSNAAPLVSLDLASQSLWTRIVSLALDTNRDAVLPHRQILATQIAAAWKASLAGPHRVAPDITSPELHRRWAYLLGDLAADDLPPLAESLLSSPIQEDRLAGLLALRAQKTGWTTPLRERQFRALAGIPRMTGGAGLPATDKWLRDRTTETLTAAEQQALAAILASAAAPAEEPIVKNRPLVQKWTLEDLADALNSPLSDADRKAALDRGRDLYREAFCAKCHRVGLRGAAVGPDLSFVGRRFSRRDILESILAPSLSVSEAYRLELIETADGRTHTGRIIPEGDYRKETIRLATDPLDATKELLIDKKDIVDHQPQPLSPMPAGLLDTFTPAEIRDLLTYLEHGG